MPAAGLNQVSGYRTLEVDLLRAILQELTATLEGMTSATLDENVVADLVPEAQGVYQLFLGEQLVYIGKTDSEAGLKKRLIRHSRKIQHRVGIRAGQVGFKAVRLFVFTAVDLEQQLIKYYKNCGASPDWNNSGFGANDPGRKRDKSALKEGHFDLSYPIDIDLMLEDDCAKDELTVSDALSWLNERVPYLIRVEKTGTRPHKDLQAAIISFPKAHVSARIILQAVHEVLEGWQITILPGYVIIYKERGQEYPHGKSVHQE